MFYRDPDRPIEPPEPADPERDDERRRDEADRDYEDWRTELYK